jgi:uncharacterized protein YciI
MRLARFLIALALAAAAQETTSLYYVVFLRPDPARKPLSKEEGERIQNAHMANIHKMAEDGLLAAAGPFENDPPPISGIFVMKAKSVDEARRIAGEDPTVREHRNTIDIHPWRTTAGIGDEYFRLHKEHPETPENMGIQPLMILTHGPAWNDTEPGQRVLPMASHILYVQKLHRAGKLAAAGNVERDPEIIGIVVFHRIPIEEARQAMAEDPAVKAGLVSIEAHRWWSSDHVLPW